MNRSNLLSLIAGIVLGAAASTAGHFVGDHLHWEPSPAPVPAPRPAPTPAPKPAFPSSMLHGVDPHGLA
jgi:hypothetical protein